MAVAFVQLKVTANANAFATDATDAVTFDSAATVGNFVVVGISLTAVNRTITSVTDDGGNTYALLSQGGQDATVESGGASTELWMYGAPITTTASVVTAVINSALATPARLWALEVSGQHATPIEDVAVTTDSAVSSHPSGSVTTAAAGNVVIGFLFGTNGAYTNEATWTQIDNTANGLSAYKAVDAATTTWTPTSAGSESSGIVTIAIQPAAAGGTAVPVFVNQLRQQGIC